MSHWSYCFPPDLDLWTHSVTKYKVLQTVLTDVLSTCSKLAAFNHISQEDPAESASLALIIKSKCLLLWGFTLLVQEFICFLCIPILPPVVAQNSQVICPHQCSVMMSLSAALDLQLNKHPLWSVTLHNRGNHSCCCVCEANLPEAIKV